MSVFGKILVFGNLIMAVLFMAGALALLGSQSIRTLPDQQATASAQTANLHKKEFDARTKQLAQANEALQRTRRRWTEAMGELIDSEQAYFTHADFYKLQLEVFEEGPGNMKEVATQDGRLVPDEKIHGRVTMVEAKNGLGQPVQSAKGYRAAIAEENRQIAELHRELAGDPDSQDPRKKLGLIRWHDNLTKLLYEKLDGEEPPSRGLRVELDTELTKKALLIKELEALGEVENKTGIDNDALAGRIGQLAARKKELEDKLKGKK